MRKKREPNLDVVDGAVTGGDVGGGGVTVGEEGPITDLTLNDLLEEEEKPRRKAEDDRNPDDGMGRKYTPGD